jgi:hypothetical protein
VTTDSFILFIDPGLKLSSAASAARNGLHILEPLPFPSATGLVSFTGLALLGCPELVPKSRAVDLIAQLYIGSPTIDFLSSLYGYLRYFNNDGIIFSRGPSKLYLIQGTVSFHAVQVVCLSLAQGSDFLLLDCSSTIEWIQPTVLATGLRLRRGHSFGLCNPFSLVHAC